jgi:hypothetical protein
MINIPLAQVPNQSLTLNLDGNLYDINIWACDNNGADLSTGIMAFDIAINGVAIVTGARALPDYPIIPYAYLEDGNFIVSTMNGDYPDWNQFGITQSLIYASQAELAMFQPVVL